MTKRLFIWVAHPKSGSSCAGIADAYQAGAEARGATVRRMDLNTMTFDPAFQGFGADAPALEPDLAAWQANIAWADHLLIVHPY